MTVVVVRDWSLKMDRNRVRRQIQLVRKKIKWSQYDLAKAAGVGRTRLSLFENGHVELRTEEVNALQAALRDATTHRVSEFQHVLSEELAVVV
jgi:transcriptional regulator with XRE-family HTH domain